MALCIAHLSHAALKRRGGSDSRALIVYVVFLVRFLVVYAIVETEYGTGCDRVWSSG